MGKKKKAEKKPEKERNPDPKWEEIMAKVAINGGALKDAVDVMKSDFDVVMTGKKYTHD